MKIIKNVEPFNDLFYNTCFYNSLFPIVRHFDKNIAPLLINDVFIYEVYMKKNIPLIYTKYSGKYTMESVLENMGVKVMTSNYKDEFLDDIIKAIDKERLVILWVDPFYESIRKDTYGKKHDIHTILIYGYDNDNEQLNIIEHKHRDTLSYEKCVISYEDVRKSYKGYEENFKKKFNRRNYHEFILDDVQEKDDENEKYKDIFKMNMKEKSKELIDGIEKLKNFIEMLKEVFRNRETLDEQIENVIVSLNNIINGKNADLYRLSILYSTNDKILTLQKECTDLWLLVRSNLARYNFTRIYKEDIFNKIILSLNGILDLEYKYLEICIS